MDKPTKLPAREKIWSHLTADWMTQKEIAADLAMASSVVTNCLKELKERGAVERRKNEDSQSSAHYQYRATSITPDDVESQETEECESLKIADDLVDPTKFPKIISHRENCRTIQSHVTLEFLGDIDACIRERQYWLDRSEFIRDALRHLLNHYKSGGT